ncbi:flagellar assembly protein FliX [Curvivirga aplysinae]|uniref:flagellar assembly protein FliX n=1 Tax=Curvivirga aplysinae TaxID=2529852 RepID=UPI0012BCE648|nr:flagellar assembly protein FliX [Curvivirga aplysinae]MTI10588.1 flagellar assembly protein FliX [Curvivirga aplysinae]
MSIRVSGPSGPRATSSTKKTGKVQSAGSGFASALNETSDTDETASAASVDSVAPVSSLDALLAVQSVDDATSGKSPKRQAIDWAENLLDQLDGIRHALLRGQVPPEKLQQIANDIAKRKETTNDPRLESILDDIELRTAVELAKHNRGRK